LQHNETKSNTYSSNLTMKEGIPNYPTRRQ
jgi:hypothetical protein